MFGTARSSSGVRLHLALRYCLNQWESLNVFTRDSAVRMDNNLAEQEMKRIALGRKNFLFVGAVRSGQTASILASMTSTCRRHEINAELYHTQLLANLPSTPITQVLLNTTTPSPDTAQSG